MTEGDIEALRMAINTGNVFGPWGVADRILRLCDEVTRLRNELATQKQDAAAAHGLGYNEGYQAGLQERPDWVPHPG